MARRPGPLARQLSRPTAYAAKKTDIWAEVVDRINGAILPADLDDLLVWLDFHELEVPEQWDDEIAELIEKRREELQAEDIGHVLLERYDF